jgi:DNA-binding NarL/FixJ family response regulator
MNGRTRIVLADDHPIVLGGLRNLILAEPDFEVVGEASSGLVALRLIKETQPDLAILDVSMPECNGILVARRLASEGPAVRVVILTFYEDRAYVRQALQTGVRGYVLKRSAAENLVPAIRSVLAGGLYVDPGIAERIFEAAPARTVGSAQAGSALDLSSREAEVLKLLALGHSNKEIATELDVSVKSVETYKSRGAEKLGLKTRAEIVRYASAQGWLARH